MFVEDLVKAFPRPEFNGPRTRKLSPASVVSAPSGSEGDCGSSDNSDGSSNDVDCEGGMDGILGGGLRKRNLDMNNNRNNNNNNSNSNSNSKVSNLISQQKGGQSDNLNHTVFLSSHDAIVPVANVTKYLAAKSANCDNSFNGLLKTFKCFELVLFHGIHGEMFIYPHWVGLITHKIKERCGLV
jgi:hypothetical protein